MLLCFGRDGGGTASALALGVGAATASAGGATRRLADRQRAFGTIVPVREIAQTLPRRMTVVRGTRAAFAALAVSKTSQSS